MFENSLNNPLGWVPSNKWIDLTPVSYGELLTQAQADGYIYIYGASTNASNFVTLVSSVVSTYPSTLEQKLTNTSFALGANGAVDAFLPVKRGDYVWFNGLNFATYICRFIYAQGQK